MFPFGLTHHGPGVFPLGQFVKDPQQIYTRKEVPPAELVGVSRFLKTRAENNTAFLAQKKGWIHL